MARKSRQAARGRHNNARLRRINDQLFANGIAAQSSLTSAESLYKKMIAEKRAKEIPVFSKAEAVVIDDKRQKYLERKQKQEARKQQSTKAKADKLARTITNQERK